MNLGKFKLERRNAKGRQTVQNADCADWYLRAVHVRTLRPALHLGETELREWPRDLRVNTSVVGDGDPTLIEPIQSGLLEICVIFYARKVLQFAEASPDLSHIVPMPCRL